jgi:Transposase IS66 family
VGGEHPRRGVPADAEHCNREQFNALIGTAYPGIVISDRWNGYNHLDPNQRQVCWSHLQRDFRKHADGLGEQKTFGEQAVPLTKQVFAAWLAYQHDHHDRARLQAEIAPIQEQLRQLLEHASAKKARNRWHRQFANNLLKIWPALWTFSLIDAIEPTNYSDVLRPQGLHAYGFAEFSPGIFSRTPRGARSGLGAAASTPASRHGHVGTADQHSHWHRRRRSSSPVRRWL